MTYLEMVNNILKRLRERTVASVNETSYSTLIGLLVNDAKKEVEVAWDWSSIRATLTANTVANIYNYELQTARNDVKILDVINDSDDWFLEYRDAAWMNRNFLTQDPERGSPRYYSFNGTSSDGDTLVDLYPIPDGDYNIRFNAVVRQIDLEADSDVMEIPSRPVLLLAYAKAIEERGEDGGVSASSAYATAERNLSDAISLDAAKHPEELIWKTV